MTVDPGSSGPAARLRHARRSVGSRPWWRACVAAPLLLLVIGCGDTAGLSTTPAPGPNVTSSQEASIGTSTLPRWATSPTLLPCPAASPTARVQLPAVSLACLDGRSSLRLDRLPARPYVINLWASWCGPCRREAPRLAAAAAAARGKVEFLGVDTADAEVPALAFLHDFAITYPQLADPGSEVVHRLPAPGIPVTVLVDAAGRVVFRRIGEISAAQLADAVHAANPTARVPTDGGR